MDRAQTELLVKQEEYIQGALTVAEFLAKLEPMIPRDASRRLHVLLEDDLNDPMPV